MPVIFQTWFPAVELELTAVLCVMNKNHLSGITPPKSCATLKVASYTRSVVLESTSSTAPSFKKPRPTPALVSVSALLVPVLVWVTQTPPSE